MPSRRDAQLKKLKS